MVLDWPGMFTKLPCTASPSDRVSPPPHAELHEQDGHPSLGEDGDEEVQGQGEGPERDQLRRLGFTEQQLHLRLRHLSGEVHGRGGEENHPSLGTKRLLGRSRRAVSGFVTRFKTLKVL